MSIFSNAPFPPPPPPWVGALFLLGVVLVLLLPCLAGFVLGSANPLFLGP